MGATVLPSRQRAGRIRRALGACGGSRHGRCGRLARRFGDGAQLGSPPLRCDGHVAAVNYPTGFNHSCLQRLWQKRGSYRSSRKRRKLNVGQTREIDGHQAQAPRLLSARGRDLQRFDRFSPSHVVAFGKCTFRPSDKSRLLSLGELAVGHGHFQIDLELLLGGQQLSGGGFSGFGLQGNHMRYHPKPRDDPQTNMPTHRLSPFRFDEPCATTLTEHQTVVFIGGGRTGT